MQLLARIRALLRRSGDTDGGPLAAGPLSLDPQRYEAKRDGELLDLTRTEFEILNLLMGNEGIVLVVSATGEVNGDVGWVWPSSARSWRTTVDVHG